MNFLKAEEKFLTYLKIFDGLNFQNCESVTVVDLSFNDYLTANYLKNKAKFKRIYNVTFSTVQTIDGIISVPVQGTLSYTLNRLKCDLIVSICGTYRFQPLYDVVHSIHRCLNLAGRIVLVVFPYIYDENGKDILNGLSLISQNPINEKLNRWFFTLKNSLSNIFVDVKEDDILQETSLPEIKAIFSSESFYNTLFRDKELFDNFFEPIENSNKRYTISWKVLRGLKI
jgi:hypothetical protein